jgi:hypothetical protein
MKDVRTNASQHERRRKKEQGPAESGRGSGEAVSLRKMVRVVLCRRRRTETEITS